MREWVTLRMLQREGSIQSGEIVTEHHTSAAKLVARGVAAYHGTIEAADTMQRSSPVEKSAEPTPVSPPADALSPASEAITAAPELSPPPAPVAAPGPAPVKPSFFGKKKKG